MRNLLIFAVVVSALALGLATEANAGPVGADIVFVVDESGSMGGEHGWLSGMANALEAELNAVGVFGNEYALIGYGSSSIAPRTVAGLGSAAAFTAATSSLLLNGGTEDGYAGIQHAFDNLAFRQGSARNIILVTDEDRDNWNGAYNYANTLQRLNDFDATLNAVVNSAFYDPGQARALGLDSVATAYTADGAGGYTTSTPGSASNTSSKAHYVDMAWATGGAGWDLNQLRAGGLTADSFTAAFVDIKVKEIQQDIVPEPATMVLMGLGLAGLGVRARRRRRA